MPFQPDQPGLQAGLDGLRGRDSCSSRPGQASQAGVTPERSSRNSRPEQLVVPADSSGPDGLGNRASMPDHLGQ